MFAFRKISVIAAAVLICGMLILFDPFIKPIQLSFYAAAKPVLKTHNAAIFSLKSFLERLSSPFGGDMGDLRREIAMLKEALVVERARNSRLNRELSNVSPFHRSVSLRPVPCEIIYYDPAGAANILVIDVGRSSGVREGMALCSGYAVVGTVYYVSNSTAIAVLIRHPLCRIPVRIEPGGERGVATGNGVGVDIQFVPIEANVSIGNAIISSEETGLVPPDLLIGTVKSASRVESQLLWKIKIDPTDSARLLEDLYLPVGLEGNEDIHIPRGLK